MHNILSIYNTIFNGARKGVAYPTAGLQVIVYNSTYEEEGTTYYRTSLGVGLPVISGIGLDAIIDFAPLNDERFDKSNATYWGSSLNAWFYYDAGNPYHCKLKDFSYRYFNNQMASVNNYTFATLIYSSGVLQSVDFIAIYTTEQDGNNLIKLKSYIGYETIELGLEGYVEENYYVKGTWLNADNITLNVDGISVDALLDLSGNSRNATPKTTKAILVSNKRNGHDAIYVDDNPHTIGGLHENVNIKSFVFVAQKQTYIGKSMLIHDGAGDYISHPVNVTTQNRSYAQLNDGTSYQGISSIVNDVNRLGLTISRKDDASNQVYSYFNDDDSDNRTFTPATDIKFWKVKDLFEYSSSAFNFNGYFYEMVSFTVDLNPTEIEQLRTYFNNKYKIWGVDSYWIPDKNYTKLPTLSRQRKVVFYGDSLWTNIDDMRTRIAGTDTIRGNGFLRFMGDGEVDTSLYTMVITNSIHIDSQDSINAWGIMGEAIDIDNSTTISYTSTNRDDIPVVGAYFNKVKLYYLKQLSGGVFRYRIDGGDWTNVDTSDTSDSLGIETIEISGVLGNHLVEIEGVSDTCRLYGIKTWNDTTDGVVFDYVNVGGSAAKEWVDYGNFNHDMLNDVNPDKIFVWLGFNDSSLSRTKAQFKADILTITNDLKLKCPNADIILLTHHDAGNVGSIDTQNIAYDNVINTYDDVLIEIQLSEDNVSVLDIDHIAHDRYYGVNRSLIYRDAIHYEYVTGAAFVNDNIIDILYN